MSAPTRQVTRPLRLYRRILKLQNLALQDPESIQVATSMIRKEFIKNRSLTSEQSINACMQQGNIYIQRLEAQTLNSSAQLDYANDSYWEKYYSQDDKADALMQEWYCNFEQMKEFLPDVTEKKILVLGSGMSHMGLDIYDSGAAEVVEIEVSATAHNVMEYMYRQERDQRDGGQLKIKNVIMDARKLRFPDNTFEVIVDKATLDSIGSGNNPEEDVEQVEREVWRVLKPNGIFFLVSVVAPDSIHEYMRWKRWNTKHVGTLEDGMIHFYHITKPEGADDSDVVDAEEHEQEEGEEAELSEAEQERIRKEVEEMEKIIKS